MTRASATAFVFIVGVLSVSDMPAVAQTPAATSGTGPVLSGQAAWGDWTSDKPGVRRLITSSGAG